MKSLFDVIVFIMLGFMAGIIISIVVLYKLLTKDIK